MSWEQLSEEISDIFQSLLCCGLPTNFTIWNPEKHIKRCKNYWAKNSIRLNEKRRLKYSINSEYINARQRLRYAQHGRADRKKVNHE